MASISVTQLWCEAANSIRPSRGSTGNPAIFAPRAVTRTASRGGDSALGDFVTGAMRAATGADVAFINTTGIGRIRPEVRLGTQHVSAGDAIIVSGPIGDHGITAMPSAAQNFITSRSSSR